MALYLEPEKVTPKRNYFVACGYKGFSRVVLDGPCLGLPKQDLEGLRDLQGLLQGFKKGSLRVVLYGPFLGVP